jgi:putative transposase
MLYLVPAHEGWLTAEDVLARTGWSRSTLFRRRRELVSRVAAQGGPNGRRLREYLAASIPADAADKLAGESSSVEASAPQLGMQAPLFASQPPSERIVLPDPDDQRQAEKRYAILEPILHYAQERVRWQQLGITSKSQLIARQAEESGNGVRTLNSWLARYRAGGFPALADRKRSDRDQSRWFDDHREAALLAAAFYLKYQQNCRACFEAILRERERLGLAEHDLPHYQTVRRWLKSLPPYLETYAREGQRRYRETFAPYLTRHYRDVQPNEIWVSDHMLHDVEAWNDCFPEMPWGAPLRLRFTCLLDFRSRFVVGASWAPHESSRSIATALRRAIAQWGICQHFYCDNGKDYLKVTKGAIPAYLSDPAAIRGWADTEMAQIEKLGLLARLGVTVTHCIVRHPQSKHVERFFGTVHDRFDKLFWEHYTGGAPHLRPDATSTAMAVHRKALKHGRLEASTHPSASQVIAACMAWIEEYHQTPHTGEGMDNRTPEEVFAERVAGRLPEGPEMLALLLPERTTCRVRECEIRLNRRRYTYADAFGRDALHEMTEREAMAAWDPNDPAEIAVLDLDGHFLCGARLKEMIGFNPADATVQQRIADSMADRRHLEKETRRVVDGIAAAARSAGADSPIEALVRTAKAPHSIAPVLTHRPQSPSPAHPAAGAAPPTPAQAARVLLEGLRK